MVGSTRSRVSRVRSCSRRKGSGPKAPMPPVLGPLSPSKMRLWSWQGGSTAKAKTWSTLWGSPNGPKTMMEPSAAWPSIDVTALLATWSMRWPKAHLMTRKAKTICRPSPQATVRHLMARRLVESA